MRPFARRPGLDFPWTLALVAAALVATALHRAGLGDWLVADDRFAIGDLWRLATGPFVHATWGHLVRDVALVALVGCAYEAPLASGFRWFVVFALVVPTTAVLIATDARWYCGLSGVSHALFAAAIVLELRQRRGVVRGLVVVVGAAFAAKPIYELVSGAPAFPMDLGPGMRQVPLAHATGVAIGIGFGAISRLRRPRAAATRDRVPPSPSRSCHRRG